MAEAIFLICLRDEPQVVISGIFMYITVFEVYVKISANENLLKQKSGNHYCAGLERIRNLLAFNIREIKVCNFTRLYCI